MKIQSKRKFLYDLSRHSEKITVEQSNNILNYDDDKIEYLFEAVIPFEFIPAYIVIIIGVAAYTEWKNQNKKLHFNLSVCREYHPLFSKERKVCILKVRISDLNHKLSIMKNTPKGKKIKEKINKRITKISNKIQEYKNDLQKIR